MIGKLAAGAVGFIFVFSSISLVFLALAHKEIPESLSSLSLYSMASFVSLCVPSPFQR